MGLQGHLTGGLKFQLPYLQGGFTGGILRVASKYFQRRLKRGYLKDGLQGTFRGDLHGGTLRSS